MCRVGVKGVRGKGKFFFMVSVKDFAGFSFFMRMGDEIPGYADDLSSRFCKNYSEEISFVYVISEVRVLGAFIGVGKNYLDSEV